ncbi:carbonic anhydrase [Nitratifractor salsuginis]|uniref:Carbonic anhydrase n=1 Tax=Nitratifractor salsuginis (strain DSM 16511 / JCM 12458 / E9I37-1) TaxID=749222 RepID=E6WYQ6_NITSE|nr:carbonic anhydrase [Nitratifractor salsuginis]ADV45427.1 Carbonate dehydratase [Nitratifractor salsuginis DSM 16511]
MEKISEFEKGHQYFRTVKFKKNEERFKKLVEEGQNPKALFIGCSDSRVMPAMITGSGPGDLFIVRNVGNFVPPFSPDNDYHATAAAIEYAVSHLEVSDIIVCGHSDCGAIKACFESHHPTKENIHTIKWLQLGEPARDLALKALGDDTLEAQRDFAEKASVVFQLENLLSYPLVKKRVDEGKLFLHGWHYDLSTGKIHYFDETDLEFKPLGDS